MIRPKNKSGFFIGVTCPGCGGKLELDEDFFVLVCPHCGSALRVLMPEVPPAYLIGADRKRREIRFFADRYLKKQGRPLTDADAEIRTVYYPYWKINSVLLRVRNKITERYGHTEETDDGETESFEERRTDISLSPHTATVLAGPADDIIPFSIGLRTEYVRLLPYSRENTDDDESQYFPVTKPWPAALDEARRGIAGLNAINPAAFGHNLTRMFHPVGAVVYFPYHFIYSRTQEIWRRLIADGVSDKIIHFDADYRDEIPDCRPGETTVEFGRLEVEFHRCPNCGFDLPGKQSFVYICDNCHQLIALEKHPLLAPEIQLAGGGDRSDRLFPFWLLKVNPAEAGAIGNLFGGLYDSDWLAIPGFKINHFEAMFKLSRRMSAAAPRIEMSPVEGFDDRFEPVTTSVTEALTLAEVIIHRAITARTGGETAGDIEFAPPEIRLTYAPFHPENYFYVDSSLGAVTFEKNLVS